MDSRRPKLRDGLVLRWIEGDAVLYDPMDDSTALLNASAGAVLELCDGTCTVLELVSRLARTSGRAPELMRADVHGFLEMSAARGYVTLT